MDLPILQRSARPIRYDAQPHLFTTGQVVRMKDRVDLQSPSTATYRIIAQLPMRGHSLQYRIRNDQELYERVAAENSLEPVGIPAGDASNALIGTDISQVTRNPPIAKSEAVRKGLMGGRKPRTTEVVGGNPKDIETELDRPALAISIWENEGGAQPSNAPDGQFGRRVEIDNSWTVYHVFTGVPARIDGLALTNLSGLTATDSMLSLNRRDVKRQKDSTA
jgi:hypothetical protein